MTIEFNLPYWYDLHMHARQGVLMAPIIQSQLDMGCEGILAMPNTKPPTAKVLKSDVLDFWSIEEYRDMLLGAGADQLKELIIPLYLTKHSTGAMIEEGAKSGVLRACKYYPPHGTTGADFGFPMQNFIDNGVLEAMEANNVVLCIHGEMHELPSCEYFDKEGTAEDLFYTEYVPKIHERFPNLKIACEHITTKTAADFVAQAGETVAASITPQHLLYTVGDLLKGLRYHLYCLPLLKFNEDKRALCDAVLDANNTKFYAGTDSAAHTVKATACGCAAGCFTGGIAPQLYAQAFEEAGADMSTPESQRIFEEFLCHIGPRFYGFASSDKRMTLRKTPQTMQMIETPEGPITSLPLGLEQDTIPWSLKL